MTPGINTLLLSTGALGSFTCSGMTLPIYMGPTALRGIRATGDTLSNVESQVFTPYKFGSTAGDRTPSLLTTRPTCYHSATALCIYTKQIDEYFGASVSSQDDDPLQYWELSQSQFPELSKLACKYLHVPASSAPVERLFSIAGKVFRLDRRNLTDQRFEMLMFIGCNTRK